MKSQLNKRIFIVDDDPFWTTLLSQLLAELGYTNVICLKSGKECIDNLHLNPNVIFLDYQMGDMNGIEVLQKVKNYFPGIGVVFCTAQEDLSIAIDAMKYGSFDYLLKSNASKKEIVTIMDNMEKGRPVMNNIY